jgi:hypothetical protein
MRCSTRLALCRLLRRALVWIILPVLLLLAFRFYWGWRAQRRIDAAVARLRALHVHLAPEDFADPHAVPANQNAAAILLRRPLARNWTSAQMDLILSAFEYQSAADKDQLLQMLATQREFLDRIDAAGECSVAIWPRDLYTAGKTPSLTGLVDFGRLLLKVARIAHERHDDLQALCQLNRLAVLERTVRASPYFLYQLLAQVYREILCTGVETIHADLAVDDPAVASAARRLLGHLLDDHSIQDNLPLAIEGEIMTWNVRSGGFTRLNTEGSPDFGWVLKPLILETWARALDSHASVIAAFRAPNYPQFLSLRKSMPAITPPSSALSSVLNIYTSMFSDRFGTFLHGLAHSRAAALLLAARLYAAARGAPPATDAQWAQALDHPFPMDPYLDGDKPLHYRLDTAGLTIWSVGDNGIDDHADIAKDFVYGSANPPPVPPPPVVRRPRPLATTSRSAASSRRLPAASATRPHPTSSSSGPPELNIQPPN